MGVTRGWRSALAGTFAASLALAVIVAALGPALTVIPIEVLRLVVGSLLLVFGLQWLRKAILRASGWRAVRDEDSVYEREAAAGRAAKHEERAGVDWYGFTVSFKGVLLEGLEVAFIVLTFGANEASSFVPALEGALLAFVVVTLVGIVVHRPLSKVPENGVKFVVGIMLVAFGTFWGGEGIGVEWALSDVTIIVLIALYAAAAMVALQVVKGTSASKAALAKRVGSAS